MDKKLSVENEKSLEWTYKIESLQGDIQVMVDKFKHEKDAMRDQARKEDAKKGEEINKLNAIIKKFKDELD